MKIRDLLDLLILAALWGASYLFMRIAGPEFGPAALVEVRVAIAVLILLPVLFLRGNPGELGRHWKKIGLAGTLNSGIPFCLITYATLYLTGGFAAIVNATSPLWAALIASLWLSARLDRKGIVGLITGFGGVIVLVWDKVSPEFGNVTLAILAAVAGSIFYGIGANYVKKEMSGVDSLAVATGSLLAAALLLLPAAVLLWPSAPISTAAWVSVVVMGIASTGLAYVLYFRLIDNVGATRALIVTYLIPAFAMLWGAIFIDEKVTTTMIVGCVIILAGTALATGLQNRGKRPA